MTDREFQEEVIRRFEESRRQDRRRRLQGGRAARRNEHPVPGSDRGPGAIGHDLGSERRGGQGESRPWMRPLPVLCARASSSRNTKRHGCVRAAGRRLAPATCAEPKGPGRWPRSSSRSWWSWGDGYCSRRGVEAGAGFVVPEKRGKSDAPFLPLGVPAARFSDGSCPEPNGGRDYSGKLYRARCAESCCGLVGVPLPLFHPHRQPATRPQPITVAGMFLRAQALLNQMKNRLEEKMA